MPRGVSGDDVGLADQIIQVPDTFYCWPMDLNSVEGVGSSGNTKYTLCPRSSDPFYIGSYYIK